MIVNFRIYSIILISFLWMGSVFAQDTSLNSDVNSTSNQTGKGYQLAPGDIVSVTVFGEPDISAASVRVPLSGIYNYPLIGELNLIGETNASLAKSLESKLRAGFLSDPKVSVNIVQYRPVIVTGAVENAGTIDYQEGMTVRILSALAQVDISSLGVGDVQIQRNSSTFSPPNS